MKLCYLVHVCIMLCRTNKLIGVWEPTNTSWGRSLLISIVRAKVYTVGAHGLFYLKPETPLVTHATASSPWGKPMLLQDFDFGSASRHSDFPGQQFACVAPEQGHGFRLGFRGIRTAQGLGQGVRAGGFSECAVAVLRKLTSKPPVLGPIL